MFAIFLTSATVIHSEQGRDCVSVTFLAFQSFCQPLPPQQCMPFSPQIGYGWLFMYFHLAGARHAEVSEQNSSPHTFYIHKHQWRWAHILYLQNVLYVCVLDMKWGPLCTTSTHFTPIHTNRKWELLPGDNSTSRNVRIAFSQWLVALQRLLIHYKSFTQSFWNAISSSKCWLFFSIVIRANTAVGARGWGGP